MNTYTLSLNRVDFEVHMIELGGTKWMLADPFLLALRFTRSYDVVTAHVSAEHQISYEDIKREARLENKYVPASLLLDSTKFINEAGLRRLIRLQLENESERASALAFERWVAVNLERHLRATRKRHAIWSQIEQAFPHFSYALNYTDRDAERALDQVAFLTRDELVAQYRLDVQMGRDAELRQLEFNGEQDVLQFQLSPRDGQELFEYYVNELLEHDDKENLTPPVFDSDDYSDAEDFDL